MKALHTGARMRSLPLIALLNSGCDEPTEAGEAVTTTDTAQPEAPETDTPTDTGSGPPEQVEPCQVEEGHPTTSVFFCLEGMTCIACDSALELVVKAKLSCVLDAALIYDKPNGLLVEVYEGMVEIDDIVDIIEVDNSLYTISCIEER